MPNVGRFPDFLLEDFLDLCKIYRGGMLERR
jgi:hypothetical protein